MQRKRHRIMNFSFLAEVLTKDIYKAWQQKAAEAIDTLDMCENVFTIKDKRALCFYDIKEEVCHYLAQTAVEAMMYDLSYIFEELQFDAKELD